MTPPRPAPCDTRGRPRARATAALMVSASLLVAACSGGGGDGDAAAATSGPAPTASEPAGTRPADPATDTTAAQAAGDDGCQIDVTGDKTASWSAGGGISALNTQYWLSPEQLEMFGGADGRFYFIVNCSGEAGSLSFFATATASEETIPYGPATYTLDPAGNVFGAGEGDAPIGVLLNLTGSQTNWGLSEPGVLEITVFDDQRLAGTFAFTATDVLARSPLGDGTSEGTITVKGSFDFRNPN